jgi:uncharacterized membrane protein HdeD (DUF308 family)
MDIAASASTTQTATNTAPSVLRHLHFARFAFAIAWAALFALTSSPFGSAAAALAVLYPAVDVGASVIEARSPAAGRSRIALSLNVVVSVAAAVGLLVIGTGDRGDVLLVWGAWAIASGAVQLAVAIQRGEQPGRYPMALSGALSVVAGTFFVTSAENATSLGSIAGYAVLGGVFFLASALRLRRATIKAATKAPSVPSTSSLSVSS